MRHLKSFESFGNAAYVDENGELQNNHLKLTDLVNPDEYDTKQDGQFTVHTRKNQTLEDDLDKEGYDPDFDFSGNTLESPNFYIDSAMDYLISIPSHDFIEKDPTEVIRITHEMDAIYHTEKCLAEEAVMKWVLTYL